MSLEREYDMKPNTDATPGISPLAGTPAPAVESGVDPETQVEFYQVKDLPEIAGQGQDVDMIDEPAAANEPAAEAEAAPAASDAPNPPLGH